MAWLAVDKNKEEYIFDVLPIRDGIYWELPVNLYGLSIGTMFELPKGSIKKLIGRDLYWEDNPVEYK